MKTKISKRFIKDIQKISDQPTLIKIRRILEETALIEKIAELPHSCFFQMRAKKLLESFPPDQQM